VAEANFKPLSEALNRLNQSLESKRAIKKNTEPQAAQLSLELWPDRVRGVPNAALRGALFGVSKVRTTAKKRTLIAAVNGIEIRFKGERFNQLDLDTWEMLLHLARQQPLGNRVAFQANALLKALGRKTGGDQHEQLKEEITRLRSGTVEINWTEEKKVFGGGLISNYYRDDVTNEWIIIFDEKMLTLYEGGYSHVDWEQRQALRDNSLAQWLHGFYSSHAEPFSYKVETLQALCGSTVARLGDFRKQLRAALAAAVDVGAISEWDIDKKSDLVRIVKVPTLSQQKHLKRRRK
jgi:hypothetical protein